MNFLERLIFFVEKQVNWKLATAWLDVTIIFIAFPEYSFLLVMILLLGVVYSGLKNRNSDDSDDDDSNY